MTNATPSSRVINETGTVCPFCHRVDWHTRGSLKCEGLELLRLRQESVAWAALTEWTKGDVARSVLIHGGVPSANSGGQETTVCPDPVTLATEIGLLPQ